MALLFSTALRNARADAITTALGSTAVLRVYSGTRPATPATALSGNTLLGECAMSNPVAGSASSGVLTFSAVSQDNAANNSGTATWFSLLTGGGTRVIDGDVSATEGGGDLKLNTTTIVAGGPILISSLVLTELA